MTPEFGDALVLKTRKKRCIKFRLHLSSPPLTLAPPHLTRPLNSNQSINFIMSSAPQGASNLGGEHLTKDGNPDKRFKEVSWGDSSIFLLSKLIHFDFFENDDRTKMVRTRVPTLPATTPTLPSIRREKMVFTSKSSLHSRSIFSDCSIPLNQAFRARWTNQVWRARQAYVDYIF